MQNLSLSLRILERAVTYFGTNGSWMAGPGRYRSRLCNGLSLSHTNRLILIRRAEDVRMQNPREYLDSIHDSRTGTTKIRRRIRSPDFTVSYRRQIVPPSRQVGARQLPQAVFFVISALDQHDAFRCIR